MYTKILYENDIAEAAEVIKNGGLVAVPTETIYGLAANGLSEAAVEKLFEAKGRPETNPISLFVADMKDAEQFCRDIPDEAYVLGGQFWPGPLTMILKRRENVPDIITAGSDSVGVRCPDNALTLELLKKAGVPLTGTSANISGQPGANNIAEVMAYFDGKIERAIDGGECTGGVPSTVLDMTGDRPRILRQGALSREDIEDALKEGVL